MTLTHRFFFRKSRQSVWKCFVYYLVMVFVLGPNAMTALASGGPPNPCDCPPPCTDTCCPASAPASTGFPIYLRYGTAIERVTDCHLDGPAFSWSHERTYNSDSKVLSGTTCQGNGWLNNNDTCYLVQQGNDISVLMSATSRRVFTWNATTSSYDPPEDFDATLVKKPQVDANDYDNDLNITESFNIFELWERSTSRVSIFASFDAGVATGTRGKLVEHTNRHWFDESTKTGCKIAYNSTGEILQMTSPTGQDCDIDYTYVSNRITKIEVKNVTNTVIGKVEYTYFTSGTHHANVGSTGDLVQVKTSQLKTDGNPATQADWNVTFTQYRYDSGSRMKAVYGHDCICRAIADNSNLTTPAELLTKPDDYSTGSAGTHQFQHFASKRFTYYTSNENTASITTSFKANEDLQTRYGGINTNETGMVKSEIVGAGACTSCGSQTGIGITLEYFYMDISQTTPDWNDVVRLVVEDTKDSNGTVVTRRVQGLNDTGRMLRDVTIENPTNTSPLPTYWCSSQKFSTTYDGNITEKRPPSAHTSVDTTAELKSFLNPSSGTNDANTLNDSTGLITTYKYDSNGRRTGALAKQGKSGTAYYLSYTKYGDGTNDKPDFLPIETRTYPSKVSSSPGTNGTVTSYAYTFWDTGDTQRKTRKTKLPSVSTGQNGSGTATDTWQYWDESGRLRWAKDGEGYTTYYAHSPTHGGQAYTMVDVNTGSLSTEITSGSSGKWNAWSGAVPTDLARSSGLPTAIELVTKQEYDDQGRGTLATDSGGGKHYTLYQNEKTMQFPFINAAGTPKLPVQVTVTVDGKNTENYQVDPAKTTTANNLPTGINAVQADYVAWTKFSYDTLTGELTETQQFHNIPASGTLTEGTHYYGQRALYDPMGRSGATVQYVADGKYQVSAQIYDIMGRVIEMRRGVTTTVPTNYDDLDNAIGTAPSGFDGYEIVGTTEYDSGSVGDNRITQSKRFYGTATTEFIETNSHFTWRGHIRGFDRKNNTTPFGPYTAMDVDWQGRTTATAQYTAAPTWSTFTGDYTDWVSTSSGATNRNNLSASNYDDLGRVFRTDRYPGTQNANHFEVNNYYDRNNRLVCTGDKYSAHTEYAYDGAGRQYQTRIVKDTSSSSPYSSGAFTYNAPTPNSDFSSMSGGGSGGVIELSHMTYDGDGNVTEQHNVELNHNDSNGFSLSGGKPTGGVRTTTHSYYDDADRLITMANYGTGDENDGAVNWKPADLPDYDTGNSSTFTSTANRLITQYTYNLASGLQSAGENPLGTVTKTFYDDLGRRLAIAENWVNMTLDSAGEPTSVGGGTNNEDDRVTAWKYNGLGQTEILTAYNGSSTAKQETKYYFENNVNASLATHTVYPDSTSTPTSGTDLVEVEYHLDGSIDTRTDQRGIVLTYTYDNARRTTLQAATNIPASADSGIEAISRSYDSMGRLEKITSYDGTTTATSVLNEIKLTYGTAGQVTKSEQDHAGAVGGTEPAVQYVFDTDVTSNIYIDGLRLKQTTYPDNNRKAHRTFNSTGSVDDRLNRVREINEDSGGSPGTALVRYSRNGTGRMVLTDYRTPNLRLDYGQGSGSYKGFDRFGRVINHYWAGYSGTPKGDRIHYTYDNAGNRLTRDVEDTTTLDQTYTYDGLHRLKTLDESTAANDRYWELDQLGNWDKLRNGLTGTSTLLENRTHNDANELTAFTTPAATIDPISDLAGNMTTIPDPQSPTSGLSLKYDAWNRLVRINNGNSDVQVNEYDGLNRRIIRDETDGSGVLTHFYYNQQWQVLEERVGTSTTANKQYVYHPNYVDAIAVRYDASGDEHYYMQDANFNVTAISDDTGTVVERYAYTPYGEATVLNASFLPVANNTSTIENELLFTGRRTDPETGLQLNRNRFYHQKLGRWVNRDPIGYEGGTLNLYEYVNSLPIRYVDPLGEAAVIIGGGVLVIIGFIACAAVYVHGPYPDAAECERGCGDKGIEEYSTQWNATSCGWTVICKCDCN